MRFFTKAFIALIFVIGLSTIAHAQSTTPGCGDAQYQAGQDKSRANAARDIAIGEETRKQPNSVLATSCFDQSARIDASQGAIFSGPFVDDMIPVVLQPMQNLLGLNFQNSIGNLPEFGQVVVNVLGSLLGGIFGGGLSGGSFNCGMGQDLYEAGMIQGINGNVVLGSMGHIMGLASGGGGNSNSVFMQALQAAAPIFQSLQQSVDAIPSPSPAPSVSACTGNVANPLVCMLQAAGIR